MSFCGVKFFHQSFLLVRRVRPVSGARSLCAWEACLSPQSSPRGGRTSVLTLTHDAYPPPRGWYWASVSTGNRGASVTVSVNLLTRKDFHGFHLHACRGRQASGKRGPRASVGQASNLSIFGLLVGPHGPLVGVEFQQNPSVPVRRVQRGIPLVLTHRDAQRACTRRQHIIEWDRSQCYFSHGVT